MEDIQNILEVVRFRLDGFLREALQLPEAVAVLSNLRNADGTSPAIVENKLVLSLANIEQSTIQSLPIRGGPSGGQGARPFVATNLYLLILANFTGENYPTGLGLISRVIGFMDNNPILSHADIPGLDAAIESLSFEFVNLDASQWSLYLQIAGTTYLPAAMYRVRIVPHR